MTAALASGRAICDNATPSKREKFVMPLTKALGQFVADLSPNRLPEGAVQVAQLGFIDCIGTMIAGRNEDCVKILKQVLNPSDGPSTLVFGTDKSPAPEVAWINGVAAHALDYDDVALRGHPVHRAGAGHPRRGRGAWFVRRRHDRRLRRRLRDLGGAVPPRQRAAAQEGLAPHRPVRRGRRRGGVRLAAPAGPRQGGAGDRAGRLAKRRPDGEFRHHDETVPCRQVGACRHHGGAPGRGRIHRQHRRAGTSAGVPQRHLAGGQSRSRQRAEAGRGIGRS
jgi:hypothetical protein